MDSDLNKDFDNLFLDNHVFYGTFMFSTTIKRGEGKSGKEKRVETKFHFSLRCVTFVKFSKPFSIQLVLKQVLEAILKLEGILP